MTMIRPHVIRGKKQLRCLAAAARQEIFDVLEQMGTVSVHDGFLLDLKSEGPEAAALFMRVASSFAS